MLDVYIKGTLNISEFVAESEHVVDAFPEKIHYSKHFSSIVQKSIECTSEVSEYPWEYEVVGDQNLNHEECRFVVRFCEIGQFLPTLIKEISFIQFTKLDDHSIVYQSGQNIIKLKWEYDISGLDYGETGLNGFVLDSCKLDEVFCGKVSVEIFNEEGQFSFTNKPWNKWQNEYDGCPFTVISRNQFFYLFLSVRLNECDETEEIPIKCWKWSFNFEYNQQEGPKTSGMEVHEVKGPEMLKLFADLYRICQLPNANSRLSEILLMRIPANGQEAV